MSDADRIDALFLQARSLDPYQRLAFLEALEDDVRREVESLLAHDSLESETPPLGRQMRERIDSWSPPTNELVEHTPSPLAFESSTEPIDFTRSDAPTIPGVVIEGVLGEGGQGIVYRGRQSYLDRRVAIKVLGHHGPQYAARFQREAKILAGLSHPHIVACHQAGVTEAGDCYLVMELIEGPNLRQWINEHGQLAAKDALAVCRDLARALQHAHASGVIHRDVKPENVLLVPRAEKGSEFPFEVKLTDLGLARPETRTETNQHMHLTRAGSMLGTPATMAPEQFEEPSRADLRTDIYGLGCVLYHMLTGQPAFRQRTLEATIAMKLSGESPDVMEENPDLPPDLGAFVPRMLAKSPEDRPQSYDELLEELASVPCELPLHDEPARRSRYGVWVAIALVIGALVASWAFWPGSESVRAIGPSRASEGDRIELRVEGGEGGRFEWRPIRIGDAPDAIRVSGLEAAFRAPEWSRPYELAFDLVEITAEQETVRDRLRIAVDAGDDPPVFVQRELTVDPGKPFSLERSVVDPEGGDLEIDWKQVAGTTVEPLGSEVAGASLLAPERLRDRMLVFEVSASDGRHRAEERVRVEVALEREGPSLPVDLTQALLGSKTDDDPGAWSPGEIHEGSLLCSALKSGELSHRLPSGPWELRGSLHVMPKEGVSAGVRIAFDDGQAASLVISILDLSSMKSRVSVRLSERIEGDWRPRSSPPWMTLDKIVVDGIEEPAPIDFVCSVDDQGLRIRAGNHGVDETTFQERRLTWTDLGTSRLPGDVTLWVQGGSACFCKAILASP